MNSASCMLTAMPLIGSSRLIQTFSAEVQDRLSDTEVWMDEIMAMADHDKHSLRSLDHYCSFQGSSWKCPLGGSFYTPRLQYPYGSCGGGDCTFVVWPSESGNQESTWRVEGGGWRTEGGWWTVDGGWCVNGGVVRRGRWKKRMDEPPWPICMSA